MRQLFLSLLFLTIGSISINAQIKDSFMNSSAIIPYFHYTYHMPIEDLGDRFGTTNSVGLGLMYKTQSNWVFGAEYNTMFGSNVKENVISPLFGSGVGIINTEGVYEDVKLLQRGFYAISTVGKIFPLGVNKNSGLIVKAGIGATQTKIKIQVDDHFLPALSDKNLKGYDRLTNGLATYQFLGYQLLDPKKRVDFYLGFEFMQGYTQNRREWNWDTLEKDDRKRKDFMYGIRAGILLPLYQKEKKEVIIFD